ncbi:MAG: OsmC family protein [Brevefilum sp.]|nr:OsmC family protein [Brevefilum sp.]MDT8381620.1 OsmC family protein [Brevefilum sp.]MDW7753854.1 OsmC family protein [Brevefilum sp.]
MSERVVVYQDKSFRTNFRAADPHEEDSDVVENVMHLHNLTPYGMLLASLAACTAIVVNSYAQNHGIPLKGVNVDASYDRVFAEDCDDCDENNIYEEIIKEKLDFEGDLDSKQLARLHQVAKACSIRKLLENGIRVQSD